MKFSELKELIHTFQGRQGMKKIALAGLALLLVAGVSTIAFAHGPGFGGGYGMGYGMMQGYGGYGMMGQG
jgi:hypothetical protein